MYALLLPALALGRAPQPAPAATADEDALQDGIDLGTCDDPAGCPEVTADAAPADAAAPTDIGAATTGPSGPTSPPDYTLAAPHVRQPQDPYGAVDYTAYTLEQGEVRLGLNGAAVGLTPRLQLGTTPSLDALGVVNVTAKADALRTGKSDMAFTATAASTSGTDVDALYVRGALVASRQLVAGWSLHEELSYGWLRGTGTPTTGSSPISGIDSWTSSTGSTALFVGSGQYFGARLATDYRFNRRDAIVFQAQSLIWGDSDFGVDVPASASAGGPVAGDVHGFAGPTDAYTMSLGYQASLRNLDVRVGVGTSSVPGAWLLQSVDIAYRFGGRSDREEHAAVAALRSSRAAPTVVDADPPIDAPTGTQATAPTAGPTVDLWGTSPWDDAP